MPIGPRQNPYNSIFHIEAQERLDWDQNILDLDELTSSQNTKMYEHENDIVVSHPQLRGFMQTFLDGLPTYDPSTHVITFTRFDGAKFDLDLPLEGLSQNLSYDHSTTELILKKLDGSEIRINVSELVDIYVGSIGSHIQITVSNNTITGTLLDGTVGLEKLTTALQASIAAANSAVQSATIGGASVPKSGTQLQLPAYPVLSDLGGQPALNRTVTGDDSATGTTIDTGGNLTIPMPVQVPNGTETQTLPTPGVIMSLRSWLTTIRNNVSWLITTLNNYLASRPVGQKGQTYFMNADNSPVVDVDHMLKTGKFTETNAELTDAMESVISFSEVFHNWNRIRVAGNAGEENEWKYDQAKDAIVCTINSVGYIGFVSEDKYDNYTHEATFTSSAGDNDTIGVIIAYHKDQNGVHHILSANRTASMEEHCAGGPSNVIRWGILYHGVGAPKEGTRVVVNGNSLVNETSAAHWNTYPNGTRVRIVRNHDTITAITSGMNSTTLNPATTLTVDLNSHPDLAIFKGPKSYGYSCMSQELSTFSNVVFSDVTTSIFDLNTNRIYIYENNTWTIDPTRTVSDLVGFGRFLYNPNSNKFYFIKDDETIIKINASASVSYEASPGLPDQGLNNAQRNQARINIGSMGRTNPNITLTQLNDPNSLPLGTSEIYNVFDLTLNLDGVITSGCYGHVLIMRRGNDINRVEQMFFSSNILNATDVTNGKHIFFRSANGVADLSATPWRRILTSAMAATSVPGSSTNISTGVVGTSLSYAREDHSHTTTLAADSIDMAKFTPPLQTFIMEMIKFAKVGGVDVPKDVHTLNFPAYPTLSSLGAASEANLNAHASRTDNPHAVTQLQVGLSRGKISGDTLPDSWPSGIYYTEVYENGFPHTYGHCLTIARVSGMSVTQLFQQWSGSDGGPSNLWIRCRRDTGGNVWGTWRKIAMNDEFLAHTHGLNMSYNSGTKTLTINNSTTVPQ